MNKRILFIAILIAATLQACKKEKTGTVRYLNTGNLPAESFLDNQSLVMVPGKDSFEKTGVSTGVREAKANAYEGNSGNVVAAFNATFPVTNSHVTRFSFGY